MYDSNTAATTERKNSDSPSVVLVHRPVQARDSHHGRKRRSRQNQLYACPRRMVPEP